MITFIVLGVVSGIFISRRFVRLSSVMVSFYFFGRKDVLVFRYFTIKIFGKRFLCFKLKKKIVLLLYN